ncbi:MAG: hypothetical protein P4L92_10885 [Rudaea sp.]|nr:hypothetical protein [Rudaea sp.]
MLHASIKCISLLAATCAIGLAGSQVRAAEANLDCKLHFSLTGWSILYKHAEGSGMVTCADGRTMRVAISSKGGGLTVGKSHIDNGTGSFTNVHNIEEVLGSYAQGEAHMGVVKSGTAQVLTKGTVSLALAGAGEGVDLGIDVGEFTLTRVRH